MSERPEANGDVEGGAMATGGVAGGVWAAAFGAAVNGMRGGRGLPALPLVDSTDLGPSGEEVAERSATEGSVVRPAALVGAAFGELARVEVPVAGGQTVWTWRDGATRFGIVAGPRMRAIGVGGDDGAGGVWGVCVALFGEGVRAGRRRRGGVSVATTGWGGVGEALVAGFGNDPIGLVGGLIGGRR